MHHSKKGSLEISIQAIVIVVLAMTLLGLGLGFVKGMFGKITIIGDSVSDQIKEQILDDLRTGEKNISFPSSQIIIDKGDSQIIGVGIKNRKDSTLFYKMQFTGVSGPRSSGGTGPIDNTIIDNWFQFAKDTIYTLPAADTEVRSIRLDIPTQTLSGSYFMTFDVLECEDESTCISGVKYAQKDIFIVVRG